MKIAIIGYSGSGKSTLARKIAAAFNLPVCHLDRIQFLPNWEDRSAESFIEILGNFLDENSAWVIDGNYSKYHFDRRMAEADFILFCDFPVYLSLWRVIRRYFTHRGKTRPDMADGCPEKLDWEFLWWVLHQGRNHAKKAFFKAVCEDYSDKLFVARNQREMDEFFNKLNEV